MESNGWTAQMTILPVAVHSWGMTTGDEYAAEAAYLRVLLHGNGSCYVCFSQSGCSEVLLLPIGVLQSESSAKRWTSVTVTYRAPNAGIYLTLPDETSLNSFEEFVRSAHLPRAGAQICPTLDDLYALGVLQRPRILGTYFESTPAVPTGHVVADPGDDDASSLASYGSDYASAFLEDLVERSGSWLDTEATEEYDWFELDVGYQG